MSKNELRSSGEPRRGGFANGRGLNVTRATLQTGATERHSGDSANGRR